MKLQEGGVGPGTGDELYDRLESLGLHPARGGSSDILYELPPDELADVVAAIWMSAPFRWAPVRSPFSFNASSSISGAGNPCFHTGCRVSRGAALGRFAALYADVALVRDPFDAILHGDFTAKARADLVTNLLVLAELEPAVRAGIIQFSPSDIPLCAEGVEELTGLQAEIRGQLEAASAPVFDRAFGAADVKLVHGPNYKYVSIGGVESLIPHGRIDLAPIDGQSPWEGSELTEEEAREAFQAWIFEPSLEDIEMHGVRQWLGGGTYLSDRELDSQLLRRLGQEEEGVELLLKHDLPFVDGLDTTALVDLRAREGEAFEVYRDRIAQMVAENIDDQENLDAAFNDMVRPELNRIDRAVAVARQVARDDIRENLVFGAGLATIGLAAGAVAPTAGAIVTALGGTAFAKELLTQLNSLQREPTVAKVSDFYFIWKARKQ